ncbi:MAG: penicillin-binding protein 2 [Bacteroidaceae bacterium]|jgi:penicillin-binding protein 2|nr:penicillin-binding protein 2 [Bacteroidaceae bacterium]MBR3734174.1 penicillin-binding protein 2 [Bacteroidaceae bacterium]
MRNFDLEKRKYTIGLMAVIIVLVYIVRLLSLQVFSDDYKASADSNAFFRKIQYPARGLIYDRDSTLMVYNESAYNIMVVMDEQQGIDTLDFCQTIGISKEDYIRRMEKIKDRNLNPGYSRYTPQLFYAQITPEQFAVFQEKLYKFRGFYPELRTVRRYSTTVGAHVLGDVGEVNQADIDSDAYYRQGDFIGKLGIESSYEKDLRGKKGVQILLRDVKGRIKGAYLGGRFDEDAVPGSNLYLGIDQDLQALGERLLHGKIGTIVAIEPSTGEVLCLVSSPSYDPHQLIGPDRGKNYLHLAADPYKPLYNRAIMGQYPPGSTFKTSQALTFLQEGIITPQTAYPCHRGYINAGLRVGCHGHGSPAQLKFAIQTSCNAYFCWGFFHMISKRHYKSYEEAFTTWKDYMVSMGFGYRLGIDLPGEKRGFIPNVEYYNKWYGEGGWTGQTIISDAIGQGEVLLTPLQIANLGATIANRGYYYTPHVVRSVEGRKLDSTYTKRHYTKVDKHYYDLVAEGMRAAVLGGTCRSGAIPGIEVCGKTGTAQNHGRDHSIFMGFAPMNEPKIAVSVYVENGGFGATYGVPIGSLIMEQYINGKLSPSSEAKAASFAARTINYGTGTR